MRLLALFLPVFASLTTFAHGALAQDDAPKATLHLDKAPAAARVLEQEPSGTWSEVCQGACDQPLTLGGTYRVDGAGFRASKPFLLTGQAVTQCR